MVIIADCGSTKCDWLLLYGGRDQTLENTQGFNPFFQSTEDIKEILRTQLLPKIEEEEATAIYFYGTGIHDEHRAEMVAAALRFAFPQAEVEVKHDLLAAARATCGREAGIACILGTGSNSCYYDGQKIIDNVPSLGWLLGDEGSGTHMGKALVRAKFYRELPPDLDTAFNKAFDAGTHEGLTVIKDRVYEKGANAYLASFTRFLSENIQHAYIRHLVKASLGDFLDRQATKYGGYQHVPTHFVGSIAYHFQDQLAEVLKERNMKLGKVIRKPIYALAEYHGASSSAMD